MKRSDIDQILSNLNIELDKDLAESLKDDLLTKFHTELTREKTKTEAEQAKAAEARKALEELQENYNSTVKNSEDLEALKGQIKELKANNEARIAEIESNYREKLLNSAIENELTKAGARNSKAVRPFIDSTVLKLNEDGTVTGLSEIVESVKKDESTSFLFNSEKKIEAEEKEPVKGSIIPQAGLSKRTDTMDEDIASIPINKKGLFD